MKKLIFALLIMLFASCEREYYNWKFIITETTTNYEPVKEPFNPINSYVVMKYNLSEKEAAQFIKDNTYYSKGKININGQLIFGKFNKQCKGYITNFDL